MCAKKYATHKKAKGMSALLECCYVATTATHFGRQQLQHCCCQRFAQSWVFFFFFWENLKYIQPLIHAFSNCLYSVNKLRNSAIFSISKIYKLMSRVKNFKKFCTSPIALKTWFLENNLK